MANETLAELSLLGSQGLHAAHCVEVVKVITSAELYAMGMESPTAYLRMPELCEALGIDYPPTQTNKVNHDYRTNRARVVAHAISTAPDFQTTETAQT